VKVNLQKHELKLFLVMYCHNHLLVAMFLALAQQLSSLTMTKCLSCFMIHVDVGTTLILGVL
jgi:hypothetical protein